MMKFYFMTFLISFFTQNIIHSYLELTHDYKVDRRLITGQNLTCLKVGLIRVNVINCHQGHVKGWFILRTLTFCWRSLLQSQKSPRLLLSHWLELQIASHTSVVT